MHDRITPWLPSVMYAGFPIKPTAFPHQQSQ